MQSLAGSPCRSPGALRQRGQGPAAPKCRLELRPRPNLAAHAKRREVDRNVSFADLYEGIADRVQEGKGLPVSDTYVLVENVRNADQANRFLDLLQKYLQMKAARMDAATSSVSSLSSIDDASLASTSSSSASGLDFGRWLSDWHYRKRYLTRLSEIAVLELDKPDVLFRIVGNMDAFKISTYFGKELILQLGRAGVDTEVLVRVAALVLQQRGVQDKGTREAHLALLEVMRKRGAGPEAMAPVKTVLSSAKRLPAVTAPPAAGAVTLVAA